MEEENVNHHPFSDDIMNVHFNNRSVQLPELLMFEKLHDPEDHLLRYNTHMMLHAASDAIKCRLFPTTLHPEVLRWFYKLPVNSIKNFQDLVDVFMTSFALNRRFRRSGTSNLKLRQHGPLMDFIAEVNEKMIQHKAIKTNFGEVYQVIVDGLKDREFKDAIIADPPKNLNELWERANIFHQRTIQEGIQRGDDNEYVGLNYFGS